MEELERRLRDRKTDCEDDDPPANARRPLRDGAGRPSYDYLVVNDDFERAYAELESIVTAERCRRGRVDLAALGFEAPKRGS